VSGETEDNVSGWTVDTLHSHLIRDIAEVDARIQVQIEASATRLEDLRAMLQERYATQTKAVDAAFLAQQTAMQTALTAAETAVTKALESAEKAVVKAETAAEKRFESVNEFRAQLADQASTFMPRIEAEARIAVNIEKIDAIAADVAKMIPRTEALAYKDHNAGRISDLENRLNRSDGKGAGLNAGWLYALGALAALGTLVSFYLLIKPG
jgi:hypothetical protein